MIPLDRRNPFAAWGHEEVKYSAVDSDTSVALEQARFESNLIKDYMKNEVADNAEFVVKTTLNGMPEAFDSNNDASVYPNVATNAYGMKKELQPEREPGENLEYYGIQADDLKKYGEKTEPEPPTPIEQPDDEIWYTSTDGNIVTPQAIDFGTGVTVVSNTYEDGKGVIKLSGNITTIGNGAFGLKSNLATVSIPDSVTSIMDGAFVRCTNLTSVNIPDGVTSIGANAFSSCESLTEMVVPKSVTTVGANAFKDCEAMLDIIFYPTTPPTLTGYDIFAKTNTGRVTNVYVPNESLELYTNNETWVNYALTSINIKPIQS